MEEALESISMKPNEPLQFSLGSFQGPLDLLLYLVQKEEIDIHAIEIQKITDQFRTLAKQEIPLEASSEFINDAGHLLWLKSRTLLPLPSQNQEEEIEEPDPSFEIIHHLVDYCRFKEAAKLLSDREEEQNVYYLRGMHDHPNARKPLGIEHLSLDDLAALFSQVLSKASAGQRLIQGESLILGDVIKEVLQSLQLHQKVLFEVLFSIEKSREELIVTFLAVLELMKNGKARLVKEKASQQIYIATYGA